MTTINGYKIAIDEATLDKMINEQMIAIDMIDANFSGYKQLAEGDKKALKHLVEAGRILNNVALEQDHPLNLNLKKGLEEAAKENSHAAKALKIFNSLNGVCGLNGIDPEPVRIFEGVKEFKGRNFYPTDMSVDEFHGIIAKMLKSGKVDEVKKILSARSMVRRNGDELMVLHYTKDFTEALSYITN